MALVAMDPATELTAWRCGDPQARPRVLITGGVHGDEFEPMRAIHRLSEELPRRDVRGCVTLVPVVNPPAYRLGRRVGEDGLDLARTCPGRADGSPTERLAHALATLIRASDYYLDLHTGGTHLQVHPLVGYMLHPDAAVLAAQRRIARCFGLPIVWGTDPRLEGRSLSVARDAGVPAIYAEYLGGGRCERRGVAALAAGCLSVLADVGAIRGTSVLAAVPPLVVEDARPNSGHMQIQHPAPGDGCFEPDVALGQRVRQGQCLGMVSDAAGGQRWLVPATHAGIVIVLRTFPRVARGESVGVVLETP